MANEDSVNKADADSSSGDKVQIHGTVEGNIAAGVSANVATIGTTIFIGKDRPNKEILRSWWHNILRKHGYYQCYGIFLMLPSDIEALRYLADFGKELHLITGNDCLVIALGKSEFKLTEFDSTIWEVAVKEQSEEGYSIKVARLFGLTVDIFPCLLLFRDIRSPRHAVISLAKMTAEEIAHEMRTIFSILDKALDKNESVLDAIVNYQQSEKVREARKAVFGKVSSFTGKTFETAMEAWIGAIIK